MQKTVAALWVWRRDFGLNRLLRYSVSIQKHPPTSSLLLCCAVIISEFCEMQNRVALVQECQLSVGKHRLQKLSWRQRTSVTFCQTAVSLLQQDRHHCDNFKSHSACVCFTFQLQKLIPLNKLNWLLNKQCLYTFINCQQSGKLISDRQEAICTAVVQRDEGNCCQL